MAFLRRKKAQKNYVKDRFAFVYAHSLSATPTSPPPPQRGGKRMMVISFPKTTPTVYPYGFSSPAHVNSVAAVPPSLYSHTVWRHQFIIYDFPEFVRILRLVLWFISINILLTASLLGFSSDLSGRALRCVSSAYVPSSTVQWWDAVVGWGQQATGRAIYDERELRKWGSIHSVEWVDLTG